MVDIDEIEALSATELKCAMTIHEGEDLKVTNPELWAELLRREPKDHKAEAEEFMLTNNVFGVMKFRNETVVFAWACDGGGLWIILESCDDKRATEEFTKVWLEATGW